jgi:hypothetical protein
MAGPEPKADSGQWVGFGDLKRRGETSSRCGIFDPRRAEADGGLDRDRELRVYFLPVRMSSATATAVRRSASGASEKARSCIS